MHDGDQGCWHGGGVEQLATADVENLRTHQSSKSGRVVVIESDRGTMHVGQGRSREDLAWLRDLLVAEIARRARRDAEHHASASAPLPTLAANSGEMSTPR